MTAHTSLFFFYINKIVGIHLDQSHVAIGVDVIISNNNNNNKEIDLYSGVAVFCIAPKLKFFHEKVYM